MKNQKKAYVFAMLAVLLWSTVSTAFKISLKQLDFMQLLFIGTLVSIVITFTAIVFSGKLKLIKQNTSKDYLKSALVALLNPFGYYLVLFKAYSILPAQIAQPLNYTWPVVLVLLSAPFLKQKLSLKVFIALIISFLGIIIISTQGNIQSLKIDSPWGVFLAVFSSLFWAIFWLLNVKDKRNELVKLFLNFSFALVYEIVVIFMFSDFSFEFNNSLFAAVYVGFFELGITFIVWLNALKYTETTDKISNLIFLSPVLALFFIHFILDEQIFYTTFIGLVLILFSVYIVNKKRKVKHN
ncbi:MAG: DMT family transporter [Bacteroidales bacterium]|nr:DMT family transporter [Bacteroidales bacterium]